MKEPYPRVFPIWFLPLLVLIIFSMIQCGCRTGGTWMGKGSAGTVIIPRTPQEINESNRLETPPDFQPLAPIPIIPQKSNPVPAEPIYTDPNPEILKESIAPKSSIKEVKAEPKPLPKATANLIEGDGGCVIIVPDVDNSTNEVILNKEENMKVNWLDLSMFYIICVIGLLIIWMLYDVIRSYFKSKKAPVKKKAIKKSKKKTIKKRTKKK